MKKLKVVLSVVLALVLALSLASGCVSGTDTSGYELVSIAVDTANAKTEFDVGEEFTSDGIVVTATRRNVNDDTTDTVDVTADAVIDSDSYRPYVGEYEINISYTLGNITKSATYTVSVKYTVVTTLVRLELEESSVKTSFFVGEEFSAEGLTGVVRLRDTAGSSITARTEEVTLEDLVVDSSEYKKDTVGVYTIKVSYTAYDKTVEDTYTVTVEQQVRLSEITLGIAESAKYYSLGEEFSTDGLTVTATIYDFLNEKVEDVHEVALTDPNLEIDSSAFNNQQEGDYKINVSYTENGVTVEQSYTVYVRMGAGLYLEINGNPDSASYVLAKGGTTVDLSQIDVFIADVQGKTDVQLTEGYTMQVFRGSAENEYPVSENTFVADKAGAYNVWVRYEKYNIPNTDIVVDLDDFIIIYVTDELQSIELNEGAVLTQEAGPDEISKTWTFTATYSSGAEKQLGIDDVIVGDDFSTVIQTENGVTTVTYKEVDSTGKEMTASCEVKYVITAPSVPVQRYEFNASVVYADTAKDTVIANTELIEGVLSTIGEVQVKDKTTNDDKYTKAIQISSSKYLTINVSGVSTITVYAATSSSDTSAAARGLVLAGTGEVTGDGLTATSNNSKEQVEFVFEVSSAGTYTLKGTDSMNIFEVVIETQVTSSTTLSFNASVTYADTAKDTVIANTELIEGVLSTIGDVQVKDKTTNDDRYTKAVQINSSSKGLSITVTGPSTITIYAATSSSDTAAAARGLVLAGTGEVTGDGLTATSNNSKEQVEFVFEVSSAGTYTLKGTDSMNIFEVVIETQVTSSTTLSFNASVTYADTAKDTVIANTELIEGVLSTIGEVQVKDKTTNDDRYTKAVQINSSTKGLSITVTGPSTITIYAATSSSDTGAAARGLVLAGTGEVTGDGLTAMSNNSKEQVEFVFEVSSAGTYTLNGTDSMNIFEVVIETK